MGGEPRSSVALVQRLHLKQNRPAMRLCFNSNSLSACHLISPLLDHHLSAPIRASGSLYLHVVPITLDHEAATVFGCGGGLGPRCCLLLTCLESPLLYVPCYDSLMVLATVSQWSEGAAARQRLIRIQTLSTELWRCNHRAGFILVQRVWK